MAGTIATLLVRIAANTVEFEKNIGRLERNFQRTGRNLESIGERLSKGVTLPIAAIAGVATKAAIDFESSFAGIRKTVKASEEQFKNLAQGMRNLAKEIPVNVNQLNRIGEAAGQLGIKTQNIESFTRVIAQLGTATNLSTDEAATALARLANITGLPQEKFSNLGSAIVALGNNFATTEQDIVQFGLRIAGAGKTVGLSEAQILGFGAALSSVGVEAEAGGTAISKVFIEIAAATQKGGKDLANFAKVAGVSAASFKQQFQTDAAGATVAFIEGLGKIQRAGGDVFGTIESLGLQETRLRNALLLSASAGDLLSRAISTSSSAFSENTALQKEAEERYKTTASQLTLLKNRLQDVAITLGGPLIQALNQFLVSARPILSVIESLVLAFVNLPSPIRNAILATTALIAILGPLVFVAGHVVQSFAAVAGAFRLLVQASGLANLSRAADAITGAGAAAGAAAPKLTILSRAVVGLNAAFVATSTAVTAAYAPGLAVIGRAMTGLTGIVTALAARLGILTIAQHASALASGVLSAAQRTLGAVLLATQLNVTVLATRLGLLSAAQTIAARTSAVLTGALAGVGVAASTILAGGTILGLLAALGFALNEAAKGARNLWNAWKEGNLLAKLGERDTDNWVRRWLGLSTAAKTAADRFADAETQIKLASERVDQLQRRLSGEDLRNSVNELGQAFTQLQAQTRLTPDILKRIADEANNLKAQGAALTPILDHIAKFGAKIATESNDRLTFEQFGQLGAGLKKVGENAKTGGEDLDKFNEKVKDLQVKLSGSELVQQARVWAAAIINVGGAARLADSDLADFAGVIDQVIARFGSLERAGVGSLQRIANAARTQLRRFTTFLPLSEGPRQGGFQGFFNVPTRSQQLPAGALLNGGLGIVPGLTDPGGLFDGVRLGQGAHELFRDFRQELADNAIASRILLGDAFNGFFSDTFSPVRADQLVNPFRDAFLSFGRELPNLIFGTLQSGGNVLGAVASGFSATLSSVVQKAVDQLKPGEHLKGKSAATAIAAQGIASFVSGFSIGQSAGSKGKGALAGAATGAAIGANPALAGATLGISIAVGAGIGALAGFFGGRSAEKKAKEQLEQNKIALIEQFGGMEKLRALADKLGVNIAAAFDAKKPQQFQQAVDQLNAAIERQNKKLEGLQRALDGVNAKAELFASPFRKLLEQREEADADLKALDAKLRETAQRGQEEFERLGIFVGATFAGIVADSGDAIGAIRQLAPAFSVLQEGVEKFGLTASPLIQRLVEMSNAVTGPDTGPLFASLQATSQIFQGLSQAGLLTRDLFNVVGADIGQIFRDLEAKGADMSIALALSQPVLQRLFEAQQRFGLVTDETTQKMLRQAQEQGLVGDHMRDVNQKILDVLIAIADVFGAKLPEGLRNAAAAAGQAADDIENALAGIHVPPIKIPVEFDRPGPEGPEFLPLASGGIVRRPTFALIGEAGPEAVVPLARLDRSGGGSGGHTFHREAFKGMFEGAVIDSDARAEQVADMVIRVIEGGGKRKTRARRALVDG